MKLTDELLPCPFCGSAAELTHQGRHFGVGCADWKCQGMQGALMHLDEGAAVAAWNRRATHPVADAAVAPSELGGAVTEVADFLEASANLSIISQFTAITAAIDARKSTREAEFNTGICVALQAVTAQDNGVLWAEIVRACGDDLLYHAANIEPDEWELAGFKKYAMSELGKRKPKKRAAPTPTIAADAVAYGVPFTTDVPQCCGDPTSCNDPCQPELDQAVSFAEVKPLVDEWIRSRGTSMDGESYFAALQLAQHVKGALSRAADAAQPDQSEESLDMVAQPDEHTPSLSDTAYWNNNRAAILDAIEKAGLRLMSNRDGFWLQATGDEPSQTELVKKDRQIAFLRDQNRRIIEAAERIRTDARAALQDSMRGGQ